MASAGRWHPGCLRRASAAALVQAGCSAGAGGADSPRCPQLRRRHAGASVSTVRAKTQPKEGSTHTSERLDWQCMCILAEHLPGPLQPSAAGSQRDVWDRGESREGPGTRRHGAGRCPLRLWFSPARVAQVRWGKRRGQGKAKLRQGSPGRAGGLPGCTGAVPRSTAPGRAAQLLAHTPSMTTSSWTPGVNQAYAGSICYCGVTGAIHIGSIHPSKRSSLFP